MLSPAVTATVAASPRERAHQQRPPPTRPTRRGGPTRPPGPCPRARRGAASRGSRRPMRSATRPLRARRDGRSRSLPPARSVAVAAARSIKPMRCPRFTSTSTTTSRTPALELWVERSMEQPRPARRWEGTPRRTPPAPGSLPRSSRRRPRAGRPLHPGQRRPVQRPMTVASRAQPDASRHRDASSTSPRCSASSVIASATRPRRNGPSACAKARRQARGDGPLRVLLGAERLARGEGGLVGAVDERRVAADRLERADGAADQRVERGGGDGELPSIGAASAAASMRSR